MSNALRKDLQRRSKGELIEMILRDRMGSETAGGDKQANIDWERYSQHHLAFKVREPFPPSTFTPRGECTSYVMGIVLLPRMGHARSGSTT